MLSLTNIHTDRQTDRVWCTCLSCSVWLAAHTFNCNKVCPMWVNTRVSIHDALVVTFLSNLREKKQSQVERKPHLGANYTFYWREEREREREKKITTQVAQVFSERWRLIRERKGLDWQRLVDRQVSWFICVKDEKVLEKNVYCWMDNLLRSNWRRWRSSRRRWANRTSYNRVEHKSREGEKKRKTSYCLLKDVQWSE